MYTVTASSRDLVRALPLSMGRRDGEEGWLHFNAPISYPACDLLLSILGDVYCFAACLIHC